MADEHDPHVVLVGLSGTGKTSIGRLVAERLGLDFVDTDAAVEARAGRSVREIFANDGEAAFRALEAGVLADTLAASAPTVVAAGGGAVITEEARKRLGALDVFVVWLCAEPAFLAARAAGKAHRPLLDDDPVATLSRLAAERRGWFEEVSDAVVDVQIALSSEPQPRAKARLASEIVDLVLLRRARRTRDHLVLVGAMGVGKTTVGTIVATRLHQPFVDSDAVIERRTGRTARRIADADGLDALHRLEVTVLRDAVAAATPSVIGAAASVVDASAGRLALETARQVVWLRASDATLRSRDRHGDGHRPDVPAATVHQREPLYTAVATRTVEVDTLDPEQVADLVLAR